MRKIVFSLTLLTSSFLLFLVQPMIGRLMLPSLGGTPAVWNVCMLFFQAALLAGYAWAHYGPPKLGMRNHMMIHLFLLGCVCFCLPMSIMESWEAPVDSSPILWLLGQLTLCVGLPFFVISSSAPLLQRWFSASNPEESDEEPWFLYAISNVGSLAALISYPFVFERVFGLTQQGVFWTIGFILLAAMFACCVWFTLKNADPQVLKRSASKEKVLPLGWQQRLRYIGLAAIPSSLMLGVTTMVSTEVGSFPLMWSIPLALYLLTFVFVFARRKVLPHRWMVRCMPLVLLFMPLVTILDLDLGQNPTVMIGIHFSAFFLVAMVCHGELARLKPNVSQLTEFYLMMSIGGVVGGAFNSLVAPIAFNSILEYPLMLVAACFALPSAAELLNTLKEKAMGRQTVFGDSKTGLVNESSGGFNNSIWSGPVIIGLLLLVAWFVRVQFVTVTGWGVAVISFAVPALVCLVFLGTSPRKFALGYAVLAFGFPLLNPQRDVEVCDRGFFGVNQVSVIGDHKYHVLINGRTCHGIQKMDEADRPTPLSYYHPDGPVGDIFRLHGDRQSRVAVVGLGIGSIAAYGHEGQRLDFYEIDPVVCRIAKNTDYFSYLSTAQSDVRIILGDARVKLAANRRAFSNLTEVDFDPGNTEMDSVSEKYGLIVLDAFGSDAVPIHLLTVEAIQLYLDCLDHDGLLAIHISSKFLDLVPVGAASKEHLGLHGALRRDKPMEKEANETGRTRSTYMIMSRNEGLIESYVENGTGWEPLVSPQNVLWTDEHANILDVMQW